MTNEFIMESFWQLPEGYNCATIAIIKVALLRYGIDNVFKCRKTQTNYYITLRDSKKIILRKDEIKKLNWGNSFQFSKYKIKDKARQVVILKERVQLCYAVMIIYLNQYGFREETFSIKDAKEYLQYGFGDDDPFNTDHLYQFLGLKMASDEVLDLKRKHVKNIIGKKSGNAIQPQARSGNF